MSDDSKEQLESLRREMAGKSEQERKEQDKRNQLETARLLKRGLKERGHGTTRN